MSEYGSGHRGSYGVNRNAISVEVRVERRRSHHTRDGHCQDERRLQSTSSLLLHSCMEWHNNNMDKSHIQDIHSINKMCHSSASPVLQTISKCQFQLDTSLCIFRLNTNGTVGIFFL